MEKIRGTIPTSLSYVRDLRIFSEIISPGAPVQNVSHEEILKKP